MFQNQLKKKQIVLRFHQNMIQSWEIYCIWMCLYRGNWVNSYLWKKKLLCGDYKGQDEDHWRSLSAIITNFNCALIDNKCTEQYQICEAYKGNDKKTCESIQLYGSTNNRCFLTKDQICESKIKLCSNYLGEDETDCKKYWALVQIIYALLKIKNVLKNLSCNL